MGKRRQPPRPQPATDEELARAAKRKLDAGERPSRSEKRALDRLRKEQEEKLRWQFYGAVPQKHYREMSGRQAKVLHDQAQRTGIPFDLPTINLVEVVRRFHDFLADKKHLLWKPGDDPDDMAMLGEATPALEKWREEKWKLARLERLEKEQQLLPRVVVHKALVDFATIVRNLGEQLAKHHGDEALELLNEALDDYDRLLADLFNAHAATSVADPAGDDPDPPR